MNSKNIVDASRALVAVDKGRGFVIESEGRGLILTAAHCLPRFPPRASISYLEERTYQKLLGKIGKRRSVWAECVFLDPVADIAVLDSPDNQALAEKADAYQQLTEAAIPLRISELRTQAASAWLLPLEEPPFHCVVRAVRHGPLWIERATQKIVGRMSGSPILAEDGSAIGVVVTTHGPNPSLAAHLPGWLLVGLGLDPR